MRVSVRARGICVLAVGGLLAAVACGDDATPAGSTAPSGATTVTTAQATSSPAVPPGATVGTGQTVECPTGQLPAAAVFREAVAQMDWWLCSVELAWRTVIGATDVTMYVEAQHQDGTWDVVALRIADGSEQWRFGGTGRHWGWAQGPIAGAGVVAVTTGTNEAPVVVGLDAQTGAERWRVEGKGAVIANTDSSVIVAGRATVLGLDRSNGEQGWSLDLVVSDPAQVVVGRAPSAVAGDLVVLPTGDTVTGIDGAGGTVLWQGERVDHPSLAEGAVVGYLGGGGPTAMVKVLDASTGETRWTGTGGPAYGDLWAIGGGQLYVRDAQGMVVALSLATGDEAWRVQGSGEPVAASAESVVLLWGPQLQVLAPVDGASRWGILAPLGDYVNSAVLEGGRVLLAVNSLPWGD